MFLVFHYYLHSLIDQQLQQIQVQFPFKLIHFPSIQLRLPLYLLIHLKFQQYSLSTKQVIIVSQFLL